MNSATSFVTANEAQWPSLKFWLAVLLTALVAPWFLAHVVAWGHHIRASDLRSDYLEGVLWAFILGASIVFWPIRSEEKLALIAIWGIKTLVVLGVMLLYEAHYKLDAFTYFGEANLATLDPNAVGSGAYHVILFTQICTSLLDSYHAAKLTFAMIGLIAVYLFYRAACIYLDRNDIRILWITALIPSVMFWSSILGKDPINLLGYGIYAYGVVAWCKRGKARYFVPIILGIAVGGAIRLWTAGIMIGGLWFLFFVRASMLQRLLLIVVSGMAGAIIYPKVIGLFKAASASAILETLQNNATALSSKGGSGTGQVIQVSSISGLIATMPIAVPSALFRPLPGEVMNPFGLVAGLEDLFLLILAIRAIVRVTKAELMDPLIAWAIAVVGAWGAMYGVFGAGNFGALDRFRLQILPLMALLFLYLGRAPRRAKARQAASA